MAVWGPCFPYIPNRNQISYHLSFITQIGLGLHNYHSALQTFPAGVNEGDDGMLLVSWMSAITPYIEETAL